MEEQHYQEVARWLERIGLVILGGLVVQKLAGGSSLSDPFVWGAVAGAVIVYVIAFKLLLRS